MHAVFALIGFTVQVYLSTVIAMVLMNEQPAHMVLAMANFVILHAVVLGENGHSPHCHHGLIVILRRGCG